MKNRRREVGGKMKAGAQLLQIAADGAAAFKCITDVASRPVRNLPARSPSRDLPV